MCESKLPWTFVTELDRHFHMSPDRRSKENVLVIHSINHSCKLRDINGFTSSLQEHYIKNIMF